MVLAADAVLLGTVAIEPNRWSTIDSTGAPTVELVDHAAALHELAVDGLEVWEKHLSSLAADTRADVLATIPPIAVLNSYASFDDADDTDRRRSATLANEAGAVAMKFNVGNDTEAEGAYAERIATLAEQTPAALWCECHHGISIAEEPAVAARIFDATRLGADRLGAIVHTHESLDHVRARFDAYGDRIRHVHVNFLDFSGPSAPPLADRTTELAAFIDCVRSYDFHGSWTIEFVAGLLTDDDNPQRLLIHAVDDIAVLRKALGESPRL